jgi:AraC-like DNA-binding protein
MPSTAVNSQSEQDSIKSAGRLLIAPGVRREFHSNPTAVLFLALEGDLTLAVRRGETEQMVQAVTALLAPNTLHMLRSCPTKSAWLYLSPLDDVRALTDRMQEVLPGCWRDPTEQLSARVEVAGLIAKGVNPAILGSWVVRRLSCPKSSGRLDARVTRAIELLHQSGHGSASLTDIAHAIGLSSSALRHLFTSETGITFRRVRLWLRVIHAIRLVEAGCAFTRAAHNAGFASSAHFSSAFRGLLGVTPSAYFYGDAGKALPKTLHSHDVHLPHMRRPRELTRQGQHARDVDHDSYKAGSC